MRVYPSSAASPSVKPTELNFATALPHLRVEHIWRLWTLCIGLSLVGCTGDSVAEPNVSPPADAAPESVDEQARAIETATRPAPVEPAPVDPAPVEPTPVEPAPVETKAKIKSIELAVESDAPNDAEPQEPEPQKPEPLPPPKDGRRLSPDHAIWVVKEKGEVHIDTVVSLRRGLLEMFACNRGTKEHESVISADTQVYLAHTALLSLGAEPGSPVEFEPEYQPPTGAEIEIEVQWRDAEGRVQSATAQQWVRNLRTGEQMAEPFVFAGSGIWTDPQTGQDFYMAEGGDFVCVSNFGTAMLDIPIQSSQANEGLLFEAFTERIPPLGTPVRMILRPKSTDENAEDATPESGEPDADDEDDVEKSDAEKPETEATDPATEETSMSTDDKVIRSEREWRKLLSPEAYRVLRRKGTERPFTNKYDKHFEPGHYECAACGQVLFESETKFNSGCGWPAFYAAKAGDRVELSPDNSLGMRRIEVTCARCDGHLGHVFNDAPQTPTGHRYCINSVSIKFVPEKSE